MALGTVNVPPKPKHTHTSAEITDFTEQVNTLAAAQVAANAPAAHTQAASTITAGTFAATAICAKTGTDYTTARIRNIYANTSAMTASSTALASGDIYLQYE